MSEAQWRRIGTQAPDPHVGRVVPFVTDVLDQALRINEHSGDHLGQIWKNLARYRQRRLAESRPAELHGSGTQPKAGPGRS